jgi:SAM-dependent methyltransferase
MVVTPCGREPEIEMSSDSRGDELPSEAPFGESMARRYDVDEAEMFAPTVLAPTVDLLAELAGGGPALEFGVGTGRVALPLSQRGVDVHGIDLSAAMVARLRAKPGAACIGVTVGDCTTAQVPATFSLIYMVFNTIMNLTTQEAQVACFRNAAAHLRPGGCFLIEAMVPALRRLPPGQTVQPFALTPTHLGFDVYDLVTQRLESHHHRYVAGRWEVDVAPFRYVWPAELDLMARLAGMTLRDRWGGWRRETFTAESDGHVSVWEKAVEADGSDRGYRTPQLS